MPAKVSRSPGYGAFNPQDVFVWNGATVAERYEQEERFARDMKIWDSESREGIQKWSKYKENSKAFNHQGTNWSRALAQNHGWCTIHSNGDFEVSNNCPYQPNPNEEPVYQSSGRPMGAFGTFKTVYIYYKQLSTAQEWPCYVDRRLQENRGIQPGNNMPNGWKFCVWDGADAAFPGCGRDYPGTI